jgi:hypothetical protein
MGKSKGDKKIGIVKGAALGIPASGGLAAVVGGIGKLIRAATGK